MATIALLAAEETMIKALQPYQAIFRPPNGTAADPLTVTLRAARGGDVSAARELLQKACTSIETATPLPQPLASREEALAWVARRCRLPENDLAYYDSHLDAIRGWTVEQLKSLIGLAKLDGLCLARRRTWP
jgi:hypothetical protein